MAQREGGSYAKLVAAIGVVATAIAVPLVMEHEGKVNATYRDPVGILTSCYGHTGPELRLGQRFTDAQCEEQLHTDLLKHAAALDAIKTPLDDGHKAAFLSFAYNVGASKFRASTLVRKANAGDLPGACAELSRWVYAKGKLFNGLVRRRRAEREVCEGRYTLADLADAPPLSELPEAEAPPGEGE